MRTEKTQMVNDIGEIISKSSFLFFVNYKGLKVGDFSELRNRLAKHEAGCHVLKNRLIRKAAELQGIDALAQIKLKDDTAMIYGSGDAGTVAKVISEFFKAHEQLAPKGGFLEGEVLVKEDIDYIAALPSREVLYAQLIGVIQAPARNLVSVLNNKASEIVNVLNNYKSKLEEN